MSPTFSFTPAGLRKSLLVLFFIVFGTILFFFRGAPPNRLSEYKRRGWISKDDSLLRFLQGYIKHQLPISVKDQFALAGRPAGVKLFIVLDSSGRGGLQPFNALYDQLLDAIFIDSRLVRLAEKSGRVGGEKTLLSFVLLHELAHRTLHRHSTAANDVSAGPEMGTSLRDRIKNILFKKDGNDGQAMRREKEADQWAVDHYLELLPKDSAGIFINEPDSLPLLNLIEGGFLTSLSQYGPYSPVLQGRQHPSIYSRVLNYLYALSQAPLISPKDALFYAAEAMVLDHFLQHLRQYAVGVLVMEPGDIPLTGALLNGVLWISSYKNKLYRLPLPERGVAADSIPHLTPLATKAGLPEAGSGYQLFATGKHLFYLGLTEKKVYILDEQTMSWSLWMEMAGEKNYISGNQLYTSRYDPLQGSIRLFTIDLDRAKTVLSRTFDCRQTPLLDPYDLYIGKDSAYLFVTDENPQLSVYSLQSGKPVLKARFNHVGQYELDPQGRFLELVYDRDYVAPTQREYHYDRFGRPYLQRLANHEIVLEDIGPYLNAQDIFDLERQIYIVHDLMLCNTDTSPYRLVKSARPANTYLLHSGYYTVLDQEGRLLMNDDLLRNASLVTNIRQKGLVYTLTGIPYSRYLLVFDFTRPPKPSPPLEIKLHFTDL